VKRTRSDEVKGAVRDYWNAAPCGSSLATAEPGSKEFFKQVEEARYRLEPFIPCFAQFERWRGKRVLEVGVGLGTDFVRFGRAGAKLSGVDLTEASIDLVRRRLDLEGLRANLQVADAEALPFADESFDLVYSWGVLHHTPDPEKALSEVRRVLGPRREARVMLYSRRSWVALGVRLRYAVLLGRPWRQSASLLAEHVESPGTKAYTQPELERLFSAFNRVSYTRFLTPYDRRVGGPLVDLLGARFGWFIGIVAQR
jgi:SAM-dependent methyltransferase